MGFALTSDVNRGFKCAGVVWLVSCMPVIYLKNKVSWVQGANGPSRMLGREE